MTTNNHRSNLSRFVITYLLLNPLPLPSPPPALPPSLLEQSPGPLVLLGTLGDETLQVSRVALDEAKGGREGGRRGGREGGKEGD